MKPGDYAALAIVGLAFCSWFWLTEAKSRRR